MLNTHILFMCLSYKALVQLNDDKFKNILSRTISSESYSLKPLTYSTKNISVNATKNLSEEPPSNLGNLKTLSPYSFGDKNVISATVSGKFNAIPSTISSEGKGLFNNKEKITEFSTNKKSEVFINPKTRYNESSKLLTDRILKNSSTIQQPHHLTLRNQVKKSSLPSGPIGLFSASSCPLTNFSVDLKFERPEYSVTRNIFSNNQFLPGFCTQNTSVTTTSYLTVGDGLYNNLYFIRDTSMISNNYVEPLPTTLYVTRTIYPFFTAYDNGQPTIITRTMVYVDTSTVGVLSESPSCTYTCYITTTCTTETTTTTTTTETGSETTITITPSTTSTITTTNTLTTYVTVTTTITETSTQTTVTSTILLTATEIVIQLPRTTTITTTEYVTSTSFIQDTITSFVTTTVTTNAFFFLNPLTITSTLTSTATI